MEARVALPRNLLMLLPKPWQWSPPSSCMGERGANKRGLERRGMSGRHKEKGNKMKEPKFLDSSGWHVSLVLPYMVTARGANG